MSTKTDLKLVKLSLQDPENFRGIVTRYEQKLFRYIRRFGGLGVECTEDILQETFIKAYRYLNDFDQELSFSSWIYRIAHNETVNYLRKNKNKTIALDVPDEEGKILLDILADDLDLEQEMQKKDLSVEVRNILINLSVDFREVLILRYLEQKSYQEISAILKKPEGTVATLINRAKVQFKKLAQKNNLNSYHE